MKKTNNKVSGKYVDGFLLVIPKNMIVEYKKMAQIGKKVWLKYGALDYKECMGDDLRPANGMGANNRSFIDAAKGKDGETIWFSYIVFKSKKHRDEVNAKVMNDPVMNDPKWQEKSMPFDPKRFCYGGFQVVVSA